MIECRGAAAMVEHYLIVSCGLSPGVDGVTALQEKDTKGAAFAETIAQRNAATMTLETIAPLSDDAIVNLPALAA